MMEDQGEWRPDPAGRHEYRFWDGERWTSSVSDGGITSDEPYDGTVRPLAVQQPAAVAPTVVVKSGHGCLWALGITAIVGVVLGGLLIVVVVLAVGKAAHDLNAEEQRHAITTVQFDAVQLGITHAALESQLGKTPEDRQAFVSKGVLDKNEINSSCEYYNKKGESFGSRFQFCFTGDSLETKNAY
jgi:hypothetical protein